MQADHVSGLPELVARTGATAYLPAGAGVEFDHFALDDGERVELGNTTVQALATPGHAAAHHAYLVTDHTRADEPWLVLTGDALLVGDAGRPDLHAQGDTAPEDMACALFRSIGFERAHNRALAHDSEDAFVAALLDEIPPAPARQAEVVAANRAGRPLSVAR